MNFEKDFVELSNVFNINAYNTNYIILIKFAHSADYLSKNATMKGSVQENLYEKKLISNKEISSEKKSINCILENEEKLETAEYRFFKFSRANI